MCVLFSAVRGNKLPAAFLHFELSFTRHKSHSVHVWRNRNMSVQSKHAVRLWERLQLEPGLVNSDVDRSLIGATWGRPAPFTHTHTSPRRSFSGASFCFSLISSSVWCGTPSLQRPAGRFSPLQLLQTRPFPFSSIIISRWRSSSVAGVFQHLTAVHLKLKLKVQCLVDPDGYLH